jgi:hypothetical protein
LLLSPQICSKSWQWWKSDYFLLLQFQPLHGDRIGRSSCFNRPKRIFLALTFALKDGHSVMAQSHFTSLSFEMPVRCGTQFCTWKEFQPIFYSYLNVLLVCRYFSSNWAKPSPKNDFLKFNEKGSLLAFVPIFLRLPSATSPQVSWALSANFQRLMEYHRQFLPNITEFVSGSQLLFGSNNFWSYCKRKSVTLLTTLHAVTANCMHRRAC